MGLSHTPYVDRIGLFVVWEFCIYMIVLITPIRRKGVFTYAVWGFSHIAYVGRIIIPPGHFVLGVRTYFQVFFPRRKFCQSKEVDQGRIIISSWSRRVHIQLSATRVFAFMGIVSLGGDKNLESS